MKESNSQDDFKIKVHHPCVVEVCSSQLALVQMLQIYRDTSPRFFLLFLKVQVHQVLPGCQTLTNHWAVR